MATVYEVNKGINKSIEFKGIKAQYIVYLALAMVLSLLLFAVLYVCGVNLYCVLGIVLVEATSTINLIHRFSRKYGENGLKKQMAAAKLPKAIQSRSREVFIQLKSETHAEK